MVSFFGAACAGVATPLAVTTIAAVSASAIQRDLRISLIIFTSPFLPFCFFQAMPTMSKVETCFNLFDFFGLEQFDLHRLQR